MIICLFISCVDFALNQGSFRVQWQRLGMAFVRKFEWVTMEGFIRPSWGPIDNDDSIMR